MQDWWTYSLSDFLLFSPRTYYRMLQRHNEAVWPAHILTLGLGLATLVLLRRPRVDHGPVIAAALALLWGWVGWAFVWDRYATINWAATYFAWLFAIEALLLGWIGVVRKDLHFQPGRDLAGSLGLTFFVVALAVYPLLAPIMGRPWLQAEVFGVLPDPTVVGTMGLLLMAGGRSHWKLLVIPVFWCAITGATLWSMARVDNAP